MRTIAIATYTIRVRAKRSEDFEPLGSIAGLWSMSDVLERYLASIAGQQDVDEEAQHVLQAATHHRRDDDLWGILSAGEFGYAAEGINVRSRSQSYQRTPDDAEVVPLYFRVSTPAMSDLGVLLVQRYGQLGVFTAFAKGFRAFFAHLLPEYTIEINRLVPAEVVKELVEGELRAIQVVAHTLPQDIADKFRFLGSATEIGAFTMEVKAKRGMMLSTPAWLRRIRDGQVRIVELPVELKASDAHIRIRVAYEGKTRMIDLADPSSIAPYIDATDDLEFEDSGHPRFESIDAYCVRLLGELLAQLGRT